MHRQIGYLVPYEDEVQRQVDNRTTGQLCTVLDMII